MKVDEESSQTETDEENSDGDVEAYVSEIYEPLNPEVRCTKSKKKWITQRLCAALDKAKVKRIGLE